MKRLLPLLLLLSCTTIHQPPEVGVRARQREIIARDVGFIYDSLPILRFDVPFAYRMLKAQVESCSGLKRDGFPRLYESSQNPLPGGHLAEYYHDGNVIVFALGSVVVAGIVRHELLHFLLAPETGHPPEYFSLDPLVGRCAQYLRFEG